MLEAMVVAGGMLAFGLQNVEAPQTTRTPDPVVLVLTQGTPSARQNAAHMLLQLPAARRTHDVWVAVAGELIRVTGEVRRRDAAARRGEPLEPDGSIGEYQATLASLASKGDDEVLIPALVQVIDRGALAPMALARFGTKALPDVLAVANSDHASGGEITGALDALTLIRRRLGKDDLTAAQHAELKHVVQRRLRSGESLLVLIPTAALALATEDVELCDRVERLAGSSDEVQSLGFNPSSISAFQEKLREMLADHRSRVRKYPTAT